MGQRLLRKVKRLIGRLRGAARGVRLLGGVGCGATVWLEPVPGNSRGEGGSNVELCLPMRHPRTWFKLWHSLWHSSSLNLGVLLTRPAPATDWQMGLSAMLCATCS